MAFVETPVLHYPGADGSPGGLAVIDIAFLLEKITLGLYWLVHDHLRETEGDQARQAWTQAWGSMVEAMVEDDLLALAPVVLGTESAYYTEEDLRFAYPGHKTSDVVIDSGDVLVAVEIGSGRPSVETVRAGDPAALRRDLERLAYKKNPPTGRHCTVLNHRTGEVAWVCGGEPTGPAGGRRSRWVLHVPGDCQGHNRVLHYRGVPHPSPN